MENLKKKVTCIIQARMSSKRLPGKVLKLIDGKNSFLKFLIDRVKKSKKIDRIVIACSKNPNDKKIVSFCKRNKLDYFTGTEKNVLKRFYYASKSYASENILRITSDCPFIDPKLIDKFIITYFKKNVDYLSNIEKRTYPDGLDLEIFNKKSLIYTFKNAVDDYDKEHVTPFMIRSNKIKKYCIKLKKNLSHIRITLDTIEDEKKLKLMLKRIGNKKFFTWQKIIKVY